MGDYPPAIFQDMAQETCNKGQHRGDGDNVENHMVVKGQAPESSHVYITIGHYLSKFMGKSGPSKIFDGPDLPINFER